jgi:hypothetical protein
MNINRLRIFFEIKYAISTTCLAALLHRCYENPVPEFANAHGRVDFALIGVQPQV